MHKCHVCDREIELFAEYWLREPDGFNSKGVVVNRGKALPFCGLGCIFGWAGSELRKQKRLHHKISQQVHLDRKEEA